jgi:hypothetical protein
MRAILTIDGYRERYFVFKFFQFINSFTKILAYDIEIENEKNVTGSFEIQIGMTVKHALLSIVAQN